MGREPNFINPCGGLRFDKKYFEQSSKGITLKNIPTTGGGSVSDEELNEKILSYVNNNMKSFMESYLADDKEEVETTVNTLIEGRE